MCLHALQPEHPPLLCSFKITANFGLGTYVCDALFPIMHFAAVLISPPPQWRVCWSEVRAERTEQECVDGTDLPSNQSSLEWEAKRHTGLTVIMLTNTTQQVNIQITVFLDTQNMIKTLY